MKDAPERIELKEEEMRRDLERVKEALGEEVYRRLKSIVETLLFLMRLLEKKRMTIKRLRKALFGSRTEKTSKVLPEEREATEEEGAETKSDEENGEHKKKRKGHGRNGAAAYTGAEKVQVPHESLKSGDPCPQQGCKGKVYEQAKPAVLVRITGQAPVGATVYEFQKLRCNLCGELFTAQAPEEVGAAKYDEEAASIIALLHYGSGLPFNRLEGLQGALGIPLPAATQWEIMERLAKQLEPIYQELIRQAAQGDVIYNDDTTMKILELMKENEARRQAKEEAEGFG